VRILVARCEIAYHGRAVTRLGAGDRVILFKTDGSLCVRADKGYKPLNYNSTKARRWRSRPASQRHAVS
jgi:endonuclease